MNIFSDINDNLNQLSITLINSPIQEISLNEGVDLDNIIMDNDIERFDKFSKSLEEKSYLEYKTLINNQESLSSNVINSSSYISITAIISNYDDLLSKKLSEPTPNIFINTIINNLENLPPTLTLFKHQHLKT